MVKKREISDTITVEEGALIEIQEVQETVTSPAEKEDPVYANLLSTVQEIRKNTDVVGYILKGDSKASVDLNDSAKIIEFAMLASQAFESAKTLSSTFRIGETESIIIEGKNLKMLCLNLGQNNISVFMEKGIDHTGILRDLLHQQE